MTGKDLRQGHELSADGLRALMQLLAGDSLKRVSSARIDDRLVWIKRYDAERRPLLKRLHAGLSRLAPLPMLRSSRELDVPGMVNRELSKIAAFRKAGFRVPDVLYSGKAVLVLSDIIETVQARVKQLRRAGQPGIDDLLIGSADALGRVHEAGLCHGRPHLRDMFRSDGEWGFLDFEEEPERVMPLAAAQARDIWLLFFQIAAQAQAADTCARALAAYRVHAPRETMQELKKLASMLGFSVKPLKLLQFIYLGDDGRRYLKAMEFLVPALRSLPDDTASPAPLLSEPRLRENQRHTHE